MTADSETGQEQRERWHSLEAIAEGRAKADRATAEWRDAEIADRPHLTLECGHSSPPGTGPLAQSGYGYCPEHGVSRITAAVQPSEES